MVDEFTYECLAIDVAGSIRSGRVTDVLTRLMSAQGAPAYLRSDSGPEPRANHLWEMARGAGWMMLFKLERGHVAEARMRPHCVEVPAQGFDDDMGLAARAEPLDA